MKTTYFVAMEVNTEDGKRVTGNAFFEVQGPITVKHLEQFKIDYCTGLSSRDIEAKPEKALILSIFALGK
jgi:hypothetical protein